MMMQKLRVQTMAVAFAAMSAAAVLSAPAKAASDKDIVDTAVGAGQFNTLVTAVKQAGLVETLKGKGPFTVFAPTDAAFEKLPDGTVESLLKPENKEKLTQILTYHVVPGKVMAADLKGKTTEAETVEGSTVSVDGTDGVTVNGAKVVKADVTASNGVIHAIDTVLMPKK
ncbi:MAG TPA: fasciclin domain-containing protein [Rhodospirillales bacterium]|nr:fasciclin domain-containing protein [Rhodospirillales bacterium]